jgi:hypothetical protein
MSVWNDVSRNGPEMKDLRRDRNKIPRSFRLSKIVLFFFWELPWLVVGSTSFGLGARSRNLRVFFKARQTLPHVTAIVEQPAKIKGAKGPQYSISQPPSTTTSDQTSHPRRQSIRPPPEILSIELLLTLTNENVSSDTERPAIQLLVWGAGRKSATAGGNETRAKKLTSTPLDHTAHPYKRSCTIQKRYSRHSPNLRP